MYSYKDFVVNKITHEDVPHIKDETVFNPGMVRMGDDIHFAYRSGGSYWEEDAKVFVGKLDPATLRPMGDFVSFNGMLPSKQYSLEDPRMFVFNDELYLQVSVVHHIGPKIQWIKVGIVNCNKQSITILKTQREQISNGIPQERNWTFFGYRGQLHCTYSLFNGTHTVCRIDGDVAIPVHESPINVPTWMSKDRLRGGTNFVRRNGLLWSVAHVAFARGYTNESSLSWPITVVQPKHETIPTFNYYAIFYAIETKPPFKVAAIQKAPMICSGGENTTQNTPGPGRPILYTLYPGGLVADGKDWILASGLTEHNIVILRIPHQTVLAKIKETSWYPDFFS